MRFFVDFLRFTFRCLRFGAFFRFDNFRRERKLGILKEEETLAGKAFIAPPLHPVSSPPRMRRLPLYTGKALPPEDLL